MHPVLGPLGLALLALAAVAAGFVDSIAGGGGIITLPALLMAGLPPHLALGTNKLQSSFGSLSASVRYGAAGILRLQDMALGLGATAIGAALGAAVVGAVDAGFLTFLIPALLLGILVFLAARPRFGLERGRRRLSIGAFWACAGLALGFYDGFFGPGTGTFWAMALVGLAGFDLREATARTKAVNFASNIVSLAVFLWAGSVLLFLGFVMGVAQAAGAWAGSRLAIKRGSSLVRAMTMGVTAAMIGYIVLRYWVKAI